MEERPRGRQPYARKVWPPPGSAAAPPERPAGRPPRPREPAASPPAPPEAPGGPPEIREVLPPSARWYGTPDPPPRRRVPRRVRSILIALLALLAGAALVGAAVTVVMRVTAPEPVKAFVSDGLAGVGYRLPAGWREGAMAPVTGFTSVATNGTQALVMVRPGPAPGDESPRQVAGDLADLYSRLLLKGDTVDILDDRPLTFAGGRGHSRALLAEYTDVVNRPAYLRVVVGARDGRTVVLLGVAQPDDTRARADIDAIVRGLAPRR